VLPGLIEGDRVFRVRRDEQVLGDYVADRDGNEKPDRVVDRPLRELVEIASAIKNDAEAEGLGNLPRAVKLIQRALESEAPLSVPYARYYNQLYGLRRLLKRDNL